MIRFEKIRSTTTLSEEISRKIENEIMNNNLRPGDRLPTEIQLGEMFGVSRTSVREATQMLCTKGLLTIQKGKGTFVSELSSAPMLEAMRTFMARQFDDEWALDIMRVRLVIEPFCAREAAARASDADLEALGEITAGFKDCEPDDFEKLGILERRFHFQIAKMTGNPVIPLLMQPIFEIMPIIKAHIYEVIHLPEDTPYKKHRLVYEAIRNKKPGEAHKLMIQHLEDAIEEAESIRQATASQLDRVESNRSPHSPGYS
ncbi:MAG: FadR/GntR family transcriptional regulator [Planctomycetota bacterium]